jgi:hypothetical protein
VNYSIALRFFAIMLAVIGVGLMAIVVRFANGPRAVAPEQTMLRAATPHTPAVSLPRSGARWLGVLFVALAVACGLIVIQ